jgi:hypothetical protein
MTICAIDRHPSVFTQEQAERKKRRNDRVDHFAHAKHLRERAEQFRRVAETITEKHTRDGFSRLARSYEVLAEAEEAFGTVAEEMKTPASFTLTGMPKSRNLGDLS